MKLFFMLVAVLFVGYYIGYTTRVEATKLKEVKFHENQKYKRWVEDLFLRRYSSSNVQVISVAVQDSVIFAIPNRDVNFGCRFLLSPRTGDPVTVILKRGARLKSATRLTSFTVSLAAGEVHYGRAAIFDHDYNERLIISGNADIGFVLKKFRESDAGKYWCVVQIGDNFEYGTDATSLTLRPATLRHQITDHQLVTQTGIQGAIAGDTVLLKCGCEGNWCDDITWLKGPRNEWASEFEIIGHKSSNGISVQSTKLAEEMENRISINELGLTIRAVEVNDSGRYWCETNWKEADAPNVGHWETKSVVMIVNPIPQ